MSSDQESRYYRELVEWLSIQVRLRRSAPGPLDWVFLNVEDLVLHLGRWGTAAPLPPGRRRGRERRCYENASAYRYAHGLTYVEGFALCHTAVRLTTAHAWCVDDEGTVHDPTWADGVGVAYLGVPFTESFLNEFDESHGNACVLHDPHVTDYRILRDGLPADAIRPIGEPNTATR